MNTSTAQEVQSFLNQARHLAASNYHVPHDTVRLLQRGSDLSRQLRQIPQWIARIERAHESGARDRCSWPSCIDRVENDFDLLERYMARISAGIEELDRTIREMSAIYRMDPIFGEMVKELQHAFRREVRHKRTLGNKIDGNTSDSD